MYSIIIRSVSCVYITIIVCDVIFDLQPKVTLPPVEFMLYFIGKFNI